MIDFFISYAREDGEFAHALSEHLTIHKWDVWIDEKDMTDIPVSVSWVGEIQRAIDETMMVVAIDSSDWQTSDACRIEANVAEDRRVPVIRVPPDLHRLEDLVTQIVATYRELPTWRAVALHAVASAAIWDAGRRNASLLARGSSLAVMRQVLKQQPNDIPETATAFILASARAAARRRIRAAVLGFVVPLLIAAISVSTQAGRAANERVAQNITEYTSFATRSTYANWNTYAGLSRSPSNVSGSYGAYYQLFSFLTDRTPSQWSAESATTPGPTWATSPSKSMIARAKGAGITVTATRGGAMTKLLASASVASIAWSPDSRWIAAATADGADVISVDNAQVIPLRGGAGIPMRIGWKDATHVLVSGTAGTGTWQVFDGTAIASLDGVRFGTTVGGLLYTVDKAGVISRTNTTTGSSRTVPWGAPEGALPTAIDSTDGEVVVAFAEPQPLLLVIDVSDGSTRNVPVSECSSPVGLSVTPDGSAAYLTCLSATSNEVRVDLTTGAITSQPMQVQLAYGVRVLGDRVLWGGMFGGVFQSSLALEPQGLLNTNLTPTGCGSPLRKFVGPTDGSTLFLVGDGTGSFACAARLQLTSGGAKVDRLLLNATDGHAAPDAALSPDGSLVAYGLSDGRVRVMTAGGFEPVYFAQVLPDQVRAVSFSHDRKTLVVAGVGGEIVTLPIRFTTAAEGATSLRDAAVERLASAASWGIYTPSKDPVEPHR